MLPEAFYLSIHDAALQENRQNSITADQIALIRADLRRRLLVPLLLLAFNATVALWLYLLREPIFSGLLADRPITLAPDRVLLNLALAAVICVGGALVLYRLLSITTRARLESPQIEQSDGHIDWGGRRYIVRSGGRRLIPVYDIAGRSPGSYRLYLLAGTRYVLSLEPTGSDTLDEAGVLRALAGGNGFFVQELPLNRYGWMGPYQRLRHLLVWWLPTLLLTVFVGGGVVLAIRINLPNITFNELRGMALNGIEQALARSDYEVLLVSAFFALVGVVVLVYLLVILLEAVIGRVRRYEGAVSRLRIRTRSRRSNRVHYYYSVADKRVRVSGTGYHALIDGYQYRVYVTPFSGRLVAIEPVEGQGTPLQP
ncbi:MAG: hypothetical protein MUE40_16845 [Anaerolineae bacterium]|nr:hypothetical protein [Anaerolineae bacterium]